ncbi:hypothetical protein [Sphingobium sp. Ant17]|uniref:hypothetical protein n=1 Tax=Sphingobium sp. Ant17 TaxID=1461752 RepID=UPI001F1AA4B2|nr:hypothetical protein [Sphingobium sp. Ant17]
MATVASLQQQKRGHICFESALSVAHGPTVLKDKSLIEFKGQDPAVGSRIVSLFPTFVSTKHLDVINFALCDTNRC